MASTVRMEAAFRRRGIRLCWAGWALFAISLTLPAYHAIDWLSGLDCFRIANIDIWDAMKGRPDGSVSPGAYIDGLALANLAFLASLVFVPLMRRDRRWLRRGAAVMVLATVYVAYWAASVAGNWTYLGDIHVGYYAWLAAFGLVAAGMLHLGIQPSTRAVGGAMPNVARTEEELRAIQELEDYLHGIDRSPLPQEQQPAE